MSRGSDAQPKQQTSGSKDHFWIPRFWSGITTGPWFSLLARNRFRVGPKRIGMAAILSNLATMNSVLSGVQSLLIGRKIRRTELVGDPIFIIGHWRSGTTLLHELLVLNPEFGYPDTFACFCPNHFLSTSWLFKPLVKYLLPAQRPMDNMAAGWDHPQEDEFALCNIGARSPYLTMAFPNQPPQDMDYLDMKGLSPAEVAAWKDALLWFMQCLTQANPKQIVLKSPPHTARIRTLLEVFPKAKFVHIVRDPYVIFPSTMNLWKRLFKDQGLQTPTFEGLEEFVFSTFSRMYDAFDADRELIPEGQFCEVRYEDLIENPLEQMRRIYEQVHLGNFEQAAPAIRQYFAEKSDYKTNRWSLAPEIREEIGRRWQPFIERYGYGDGSGCRPPQSTTGRANVH